MKTISIREYKRRVFNACLLECFGRIELQGTGLNEAVGYHECYQAEMAKKMSDAFYTDLLTLNDCTIDMTKKKLSESVTFIKDCINISEAIAEDKAEICAKEELEIPEDQQIELGEEDTALINKVFEEKNPELQVDQIRDATVNALLAEDKKAQEIKDSLNIANSQVAAGADPKILEETVSRLNRGPTSLMNAIINHVSTSAVKDVNENSTAPVSVGKVLAENAEEIKDRAAMMYMLFEAASVFGIKKYTSKEVEKLANEIYYNK